jgi:hypothetical protein
MQRTLALILLGQAGTCKVASMLRSPALSDSVLESNSVGTGNADESGVGPAAEVLPYGLNGNRSTESELWFPQRVSRGPREAVSTAN